MQSGIRGEQNCFGKCAYDMWCYIRWESGMVWCGMRKEVNKTVLWSVPMTYDVVLVEKMERCDGKWEKRWTQCW